MIYILQHRDAKFSGYFSRAHFDNGRGSTNSRKDRDKLVKLGCKDITEKYWAEREKEEEKKKKEAAAKKAKEKETDISAEK